MKRIKNPNKMSMSFKEEEMWMREYLNTKMSASVYIKELILEDMKNKGLLEEFRNEY